MILGVDWYRITTTVNHSSYNELRSVYEAKSEKDEQQHELDDEQQIVLCHDEKSMRDQTTPIYRHYLYEHKSKRCNPCHCGQHA